MKIIKHIWKLSHIKYNYQFLRNTGFILKSPIKESNVSVYNFISDEGENIENDSISENYTKEIEYF